MVKLACKPSKTRLEEVFGRKNRYTVVDFSQIIWYNDFAK